MDTRNDLLARIAIASGAIPTDPTVRNISAADIVTALGGVISEQDTWKSLLQDWLDALTG